MRRLLLSLLLILALPAPVAADQPACRDHLCPPTPGPVAMGRLATAGAETNSAGNGAGPDGGSTQSVIFVTTPVRTGSRAWSIGRGNNFIPDGVTLATGRTYFARGYFRLSGGLPSSSQPVFIPGAASVGAGVYNVLLDTTGALSLRSNTTVIGSPSAALSLDQWYRVEVSWNIGAGSADDSAELRIDGITVASESGATRATSYAFAGTIVFGTSASLGTDLYLDDVALNDDQGASQNSWPGDGAVVLLLPTADSAKGTGWTNDAASTTSLFSAVDNTPPVGIADTTTGSGLHQLRNATSNANSNYDATMTTYAAAGIPAGATINVIDPIIATGAPVSTSAKQGTVGVVSNPTIANVALGAGGTAGAFWSSTAAGTYATGWKTSHGTTTYAPTVVLATAPVMRVTQVTSSSRVAMVCFMGIYVDWTPPPAAPADPIRQDNSSTLFPSILQAVNRGASF